MVQAKAQREISSALQHRITAQRAAALSGKLLDLASSDSDTVALRALIEILNRTEGRVPDDTGDQVLEVNVRAIPQARR